MGKFREPPKVTVVVACFVSDFDGTLLSLKYKLCTQKKNILHRSCQKHYRFCCPNFLLSDINVDHNTSW